MGFDFAVGNRTTFLAGDLRIDRIVELEGPFRAALTALPKLTPELLAEHRGWLQPHFMGPDDVFRICYQSWLVRTPHHTILLDSCIGNDKPRPLPDWNMKSDDRFMRSLAAAGAGVGDIDYVMCTHLHGDHVGWNTRQVNGEWVPTFPNARYVINRRELEATQAADARAENPTWRDSVLPVLQANQAEVVEDDYQLGDHVRIQPTPGHTAGHVAFAFGRQRDEAVMTGDLLHVPLQMRYPEFSFHRDRDPELSARTRRAFLERYCDTPTLCCTAHFSSPSVGRVRRWGDGYRLENVEAG